MSKKEFTKQLDKAGLERLRVKMIIIKTKRKMTNIETINKNIELTFAFVRELIKNPKLLQLLPDKCEIDFIESDFSSLSEKELSKKVLISVNHTFDIISKKKTHSNSKRIHTLSRLREKI